MRLPKVSCFYVSKKGKVYDNQAIITEAISVTGGVVKCAVGITVATATLETVLGLTAHYGLASTIVAHAQGSEVSTVVLASYGKDIRESVQPLIQLLQDLAEPFSLGFAIKGVLYKMTGKEQEGDTILKNSIVGYLVIQFLPQLFSILGQIKIS